MRRYWLLIVSLVLWLRWQTAVYAQTSSAITITTITQPTGSVEAGEEIGINVTYKVGGEQPIAADAQYIIDVDLLDDATPPQTVASCRDLLAGIQGLQPGQDNSYTCQTAVPAAGSYTITAQILDSNNLVVASQSEQTPLVVSEAVNILPSGVVQIFAGLAIFSAIMLIVAVGTETVIDSVKVALGLKRKISSLDALKQLGAYLPGELADFGVAQAGQKQVTTLLSEMQEVVIPATKLPDLSAAVQAGNLTEALTVLQAMALDSTAVYAVQLYPGAVGRIATVNLRWQDPDSRQVEEISGNFGTADLAPSFDDAPLHYQLAVVVSQYAELLRHSYWADGLNFEALRIRSQRLASQLGTEEAVELAGLVERSSNQ